MTKDIGNPRRMDIAGFWTPSPIEIFHPGPTAAERMAANVAKARLAAMREAENAPDCPYVWHDISTLIGESK